MKLDLAYTRGVVIEPREHLTEWVPREGIVLVNSKTIGLSPMMSWLRGLRRTAGTGPLSMA